MRIDLRPIDGGDRVLVQPAAYLGDKFRPYCDACNRAGAFYSRSAGTRVPVGAVATLVRELQAEGFVVHIDPAVEAALRKAAAAAKAEGAELQAAISKVQESLKGRGLSLFRFQAEGVAWLSRRNRALLADEMGLGKTVQTLMAIPEDDPPAVIVVAPAAVKGVWREEARRWRPDLRPYIVEGKGSFEWPRAGTILITNYDVLPLTQEELDEREEAGKRTTRAERRMLFRMEQNEPVPGTILIFDEAHALKTPRAQRTVRARALAQTVLGERVEGRVWALTGTPILNRPPELWSLLQLADLDEESFGSWTEFVRLFRGARGKYSYSWGEPSAEVIERIRRVSLRRRRIEVLPDLPTKLHRFLEVPLDETTKAALNAILEALRKKGVEVGEAFDEAMFTKMTRVAFEEMSRLRAILAKAKIPTMLSLVEDYEEQDEPVVVFSAHRAGVDLLGQRKGWATITGDTAPEDRTRIVKDFQEGKLVGLGVTIKAGGVGLTLTHAAHALFVDLEWTPALNAQAEDRLCRIGQTRGVQVTRLVADHVLDERVAELLAEKQAIIEAATEAAAVKELPTGDTQRAEDLERIAEDAAKLRAEAEKVSPSKPAGVKAERRPAATRTAAWSGMVLRELSLDPWSHGGWLPGDENFGSSLAAQLDRWGGLTDRQWAAGVKTAAKYSGRDTFPGAAETFPDLPDAAAAPAPPASSGNGQRGPHGPETPLEEWCSRGLLTLAGLDGDYAAVRNDVGFNRMDGDFGHSLAEQLQGRGVLSEKQWKAAAKLLWKYQGQIGAPPEDAVPGNIRKTEGGAA